MQVHTTRHVSCQARRGECGVHDCPMCSCRRLPLYEGNARPEYLPSSISTSQAVNSPKQAGVCIPRPVASRSQQTFASIYMSIDEQNVEGPMTTRAVKSLPRIYDSQTPIVCFSSYCGRDSSLVDVVPRGAPAIDYGNVPEAAHPRYETAVHRPCSEAPSSGSTVQ